MVAMVDDDIENDYFFCPFFFSTEIVSLSLVCFLWWTSHLFPLKLSCVQWIVISRCTKVHLMIRQKSNWHEREREFLLAWINGWNFIKVQVNSYFWNIFTSLSLSLSLSLSIYLFLSWKWQKHTSENFFFFFELFEPLQPEALILISLVLW